MAAHLTSYVHPPGSSDCAAVSAGRAGQAAGARFEPPRRPADRRSAAAAVLRLHLQTRVICHQGLPVVCLGLQPDCWANKQCKKSLSKNKSDTPEFAANVEGKKEMFYLTIQTTHFYLRLYGVTHNIMVKDHSDSEKGNPLPPHGLFFSISSKDSFICTIPQTG